MLFVIVGVVGTGYGYKHSIDNHLDPLTGENTRQSIGTLPMREITSIRTDPTSLSEQLTLKEARAVAVNQL